ncbi:MAG: M50 family metallopeptidase [Patescibacteria group bacterium]
MSLFFFILILVALIVVHELGHFAVAKFFKIRVDEFGVGFPPRLIAKKVGETIYSVNLLFFGGFVRIFGENKSDAGEEPRSFANKSKWIQSAVVAAGILCNILFAWLILSVGYMVGLPTSVEHVGIGEVSNPKTLIVGVLPESPAQKAEMQAGSAVVSITTGAGEELIPNSSSEAQNFIKEHQDESLVIKTTTEKGEEKTFVVKAAEGLVAGKKAVGVQLDDVGLLQLPVHLALIEGAILTWHMTGATAVGLFDFFSQIFRGIADFNSVAGPIGIADIGAKAVSNGFAAAVSLTALISINLALINVLPIPGLDGGRLLVIAIEGITRRTVSERLMLGLSIGGFGLLILLMLVVSYHDILRLIG